MALLVAVLEGLRSEKLQKYNVFTCLQQLAMQKCVVFAYFAGRVTVGSQSGHNRVTVGSQSGHSRVTVGSWFFLGNVHP